jgi:hypothetical protein
MPVAGAAVARAAAQGGIIMLMLWLAAAAFAAQTATAASQPPSSAPKPPEKITITGCVERADQMRGADTVGTTTDSMHFVLVNIPSSDAVGTTGSARPAMDKGYRLDGDEKQLNPHVGHKVEIVGVVDESAATTGAASSINGPMVKVQSVKMLSETCGR